MSLNSTELEKLDTYLENLQPVYHEKGVNIIMPSGSGKSYWMKNLQHTTYEGWTGIPKKSFVDADPILWATGVMPKPGEKWDDFEQIMQDSERVIVECKKRGLWIMGATWWEIENVDAVVILPKERNIEILNMKEGDEKFDEDYYEKELAPYINNTLKPMALKAKVPIFSSIEECAKFIIASGSLILVSCEAFKLKF